MLEASHVELLESGCALIVGTVAADGSPHAARGWGLTLLPERAIRVLVAADELAPLGYDGDAHLGTHVAVTGCNVLSLRSVQLKGRLRAVEPATNADRHRAEDYCDQYFGDVAVVDAIPRHMMERMVPVEFSAYTVDIDEAYDQTPGPGAGGVLTGGDAW